jgi:hypothetical protein
LGGALVLSCIGIMVSDMRSLEADFNSNYF